MASAEELLRFYGLDEPDKPVNPSDVDGKDFQIDIYFQELIGAQSKRNLKALSAKQKQIADEIKSFDSELQSIVYDNYTKFLQASDTINSMKGGLQTLSTQLGDLLSKLKDIQTGAGTVRKDLDPNRKRIQKLCGITRLLEKIDFISHLPSKLKAHVEYGNYETAVENWLLAEPILSTQQFKSFKNIKAECDTIIKQLKGKVAEKMIDKNTNSRDAIQCAYTLLKLKENPTNILPLLSKTRIEISEESITKIESSIGIFAKKNTNSGENDQNEPPNKVADPFELIRQLHTKVVIEAFDFIHGYQTLLLPFSKLVVDKTKKEDPMDDELRNYRTKLFSKLLKTMSLESVCALDCEDFSRFITDFGGSVGVIGLFSQQTNFTQWVMKKYIAAKLDIPKTNALNAIYGKFKTNNDKDSNPTDNNSDKTDQENLTASTASMNVSLSKKTDYEVATEALRIGIRTALNELDALAAVQSDSRFLIMQATSNMISVFIQELIEVDPRFTMTAFGVANLLSSKLVKEVFDQISRFDPENPFLAMSENSIQDAMNAAKSCLNKFIETKRRMLSDLLISGMMSTSWLDAKTPYDVSIPTAIILQELVAVWNQLSTMFGDSSSSSTSASRQRSVYSGYSGTAFNSSRVPMFHGLREDNVHQIDRLFTTLNRLHLGKPPSFNAKSVLSAIAMYTLKTLLEQVRNITFNCHGFNQMQVDAYFIYGTLFDKVQDQTLFVALIDEMLSSAADRTVDPIPFKSVVLQDIYIRSAQKPADANINKKDERDSTNSSIH